MSFIQLYGGNAFNFSELNMESVSIEAIAHSLSNLCRWTGHCKFHYSVAQHSVYAHDIAIKSGQEDKAWEALMHDSPESVIADLSRPLKVRLPDYSEFCNQIETSFGKWFNYPHPMTVQVKEIDDRMLVTEYYQIVYDHNPNRVDLLKSIPLQPYDLIIKKWTPEKAKKEFLSRASLYWKGD